VELELTKLGVGTLSMLITKHASMLAFKSVVSMEKLCLDR
jgi:hypothetical protein